MSYLLLPSSWWGNGWCCKVNSPTTWDHPLQGSKLWHQNVMIPNLITNGFYESHSLKIKICHYSNTLIQQISTLILWSCSWNRYLSTGSCPNAIPICNPHPHLHRQWSYSQPPHSILITKKYTLQPTKLSWEAFTHKVCVQGTPGTLWISLASMSEHNEPNLGRFQGQGTVMASRNVDLFSPFF